VTPSGAGAEDLGEEARVNLRDASRGERPRRRDQELGHAIDLVGRRPAADGER
jgi:hypothetical protein